MTQGERVKAVRKELSLTLEKFGAKLGVGKTAISKIEKGERALTEQMMKSICREFNVSYDWLLSGDGEMFTDLPQTILDELCRQYDLDDLDRSLFQEYLKMDARDRQVLKDYIRRVFKTAVGVESAQDRIDAEVESYRRELELEASQAEELSVSGESGGIRRA